MMIMRLAAIVWLLFAVPCFAQQAVPPLTQWYWQISSSVKTGYAAAKVYDIDTEAATSTLVSQLKAAGHIVICYVDVGGWEPYRSDASQFPASVIGNKEAGWNEKYLDIRSPTVRTLMQARFVAAQSKGCSGIEPDVLDTWQNNSGFPITEADEVNYITWIGTTVHSLGMLAAQKNVPELTSKLVGLLDFAIEEDCFKYQECKSYTPYVGLGKAVLGAEYGTYSATKCSRAKTLGISLAYFNLSLDGRKYKPCP